MSDLITEIRYSKAKLRNIIYYRLEVEPTEIERFRCQYMHILRKYRKDTIELLGRIKSELKFMPDLGLDYEFLSQAVNMISPKVKTEGCLETIKNLSTLFI